ncbi:4,5-DOPA dioxygenase extradiol [Sphingomonas sp. LY160]|uniref:4,5-DOPA-extradiol-dioxygenase n=1 Tax=Sphingomonas sp. LY160 TaxID=3095342 RepID=UPI002ADEBA7B|nr:4,5-DOPA dioxygenase extradiol [Sphingomonas sp. LY160]MEA1073291.1 4,5-DOPA dioxygenase extradiol [Sphingomonas sp. LY160]
MSTHETLMPALFIGHGSPMNTLELNGYTRAWRRLGKALPRPRAILVISAHWFIGATAVTAMARPRTIHDFYGFPDDLFEFDYPAPGMPELAGEIAEIVKPHWVGADRDQWGLDHGTWSVLTHLFPHADVPVVQLSINALKPLEYHVDVGLKLSALRRSGVLIVSSGNVVHNLRRIDWDDPDGGADWAQRFDEAVAAQMSSDPAHILRALEHQDFDMAVPTPDHFIPLLYTAGLAATDGGASAIVRGYAMGSLSMTCYGIGMDRLDCAEGDGAALLPVGVPADQTNI